jgi:hypothetical protein
MYYKAKRDQVEGSKTCLGVRLEIQNLNSLIDFSDPR